ncbi:filament-like plant protein 7 [Neltuma alba]|uniref:filament-like plant protein 7 n=1 Tax=Neltuma alba TaxID=207710 RepID=UPI0010A42C7D|nr:filament-like plant protein 7 [Prosopis alba]
MNYKPWQWRKGSAEKTILGMEKSVNPSRTTKEEGQKLPTCNEDGPEKSSKSLNEKLASVLLDCYNGDNPSTKHSQKSQEGIPGEDEEKQVKSIEGEEEHSGKEVSDEKVTQTDATMHVSSGAVLNTSRDHDKIQEGLEVKLRETSKRLDDLTTENTCLTSALLSKEKSIEELLKSKHQVDGELSTIMARLDSMEKENAFLRYELHMLEKELEIRKEEMEYSRQYADASHIQYLEREQEASKLEAECQRLRLLLQKRLPTTSSLLRKETDTTRRKPSPAIGNHPDASEMSISSMIKRLQDLDEENMVLKGILTEKNTELDSSRFMYAQIASRLSQAEILLRKHFEEHKSMELATCHPTSDELSSLAKSKTARDKGVSSSGSWALVSELEHLGTEDARDQKDNKDIEGPDPNSIDNYVEMEKRAIVSVDTPNRGQCSDIITGRELVPVEQDLHFSDSKQETQFKYAMFEKSFDWLQIVLNAILEQERISKRSLDELFEDIKIALGRISHPTSCKSESSDVSNLSGVAEWKNNPHFNVNLSKSIHRIIKLIERIAIKSLIYSTFSDDSLEKNQHSEISQSPPSKEYFVHVLKWKFMDLNPLLHRFVHTCKDLLVGRADFEKFAEEVAFALDWSINHCDTPTDASFARERIKNHFSCHQSQNEESVSSLSDASPDDQSALFLMKNNQSDHIEENQKLNDELTTKESVKKNLEAMLFSVYKENGDLTQQLQEAKSSIEVLQSELEAIKESKGIIEDQFEKQKLINEDLDTQLTIAHSKLNDIFQKFSSLEVELEDKKISCEELESTCLELQLQLESIVKKESPTPGRDEMEKIYQTGWEITTASSKLAECQGTILNLGKQLKALASSNESALFERIMAINPTQKKNLIRRSSLRSQMQAEDETKAGILASPQIEENESSKDVEKPPIFDLSTNSGFLKDLNAMVSEPKKDLTSEQDDRKATKGAKAIVKTKKQGAFEFLRKLLLRKMKFNKGKGNRT